VSREMLGEHMEGGMGCHRIACGGTEGEKEEGEEEGAWRRMRRRVCPDMPRNSDRTNRGDQRNPVGVLVLAISGLGTGVWPKFDPYTTMQWQLMAVPGETSAADSGATPLVSRRLVMDRGTARVAEAATCLVASRLHLLVAYGTRIQGETWLRMHR